MDFLSPLVGGKRPQRSFIIIVVEKGPLLDLDGCHNFTYASKCSSDT
jgi:hypothetical protein